MTQQLDNIDTVLLDIEGTICPINFVKETLFPYALTALPSVLRTQWNNPTFTPYRDAFPAAAKSSPEALEAHVRDLTARDVKVACLKNLQGYLWETGYKSHAFSTPLFADVLPALTAWHEKGISTSIYSSGSVFAQKLLFGHIRDMSSEDPDAVIDRTDLIQMWFDTTNAGPKTEKGSYEMIARSLWGEKGMGAGAEDEAGVGKVLFLSDNVREVRAALEAGMKAVVFERPGNAELLGGEREEYDVVTSFEQIRLG